MPNSPTPHKFHGTNHLKITRALVAMTSPLPVLSGLACLRRSDAFNMPSVITATALMATAPVLGLGRTPAFPYHPSTATDFTWWLDNEMDVVAWYVSNLGA